MRRCREILFLVTLIVLWVGLSNTLLAQRPSGEISKIEVKGNVRSEESLILLTSGLSVGASLTAENVQSAMRSLYALGIFSDIRVYAYDEPGGRVRLVIDVEEFPVLGKVILEGNDKIKKEELEEQLGFVEGQWISPKDIRDGQRRILGLYEEKGYLLARTEPKLSEPGEDGKVTLSFRMDEGKKVQVKKIRILGNEAIDDSEIKKQMETREDRWWREGDFKKDVYQEDLGKIVEFYRKEGYRDAEVVRDSIYYDDSKESMFIDIIVSEGDQYRFGRITWEGNEVFSDRELAEKIAMKRGEVYREDELELTRYNIESAYQEGGYLRARAIPRMTPVEDRIDLHFQILEGSPSKVRMINIEGNTRTKERVIRRELSIKPGRIFKRSALDRSRRDVYLLNFFKNVEVETSEPLEDGSIDLTFRVEEKSTGTASMGAGYSERDGLVGTIGLSIPNLFGNGQRLDFNWDFGTRREVFQLGFTEPWLFDTPTAGSFRIYRTTWSYWGKYDVRRQGGYVSVGRRLSWPDRYSRVYLNYRLQQAEYLNFDEDYTGRLRDEKPWTTSSVGATYIRDSRDMPEFPTRGSVISYKPEIASGLIAGNVNYHRHVLDSIFYFPTFWKLVLSLNTRLGFVSGFSGSDEVPFIEKFTPGGTYSDGVIRGYDDRSVGPRDDKGYVAGGRSTAIFNLEYRFPIVEQQVYGLLFADAGNAWEWVSEIDLSDLRRSAGFGIRIVAPIIGLIGFDIAYGFDREDVDGRPAQWKTHFQFGPQFLY